MADWGCTFLPRSRVRLFISRSFEHSIGNASFSRLLHMFGIVRRMKIVVFKKTSCFINTPHLSFIGGLSDWFDCWAAAAAASYVPKRPRPMFGLLVGYRPPAYSG